MKTIIQHDEKDCGAACLSMIASHYGLYYNISKYREITKTDRNGTNLYGIVDGASKIGLNAKSLSGKIKDLLNDISANEISFPFVAHMLTEDGMQHFIVVVKFKKEKFLIYDPAKGKYKLDIEKFTQKWTGYIVIFRKSESFEKRNYKKGNFTKFFSLLKNQKRLLTGIIIMSVIISIIGISGAFVFETVLDNFSSKPTIVQEGIAVTNTYTAPEDKNILDIIVGFFSKNSNNLNSFFIVLIFLYIIQGFIDFSRGYLLSLLSKNIDIKLMLSYYNHIIDLPISIISTRNTGEYLSRFSDASAIRNAISGATLTLILDSIMAIACGIFLFLENKLLFLVSLIMIFLYAIVVILYKKPLKYANRNIMENNARVESFLKESIDGISTVKANQAEMSTKEKNTNKFISLMKAVFHGNILDASLDSICGTVELIGTVIILWIGFGLVKSNIVSIGSLISFYALLNYFSTPIKNVINLQPMMQTAVVAADRLNDILDVETEKIDYNKKDKLSISSIELKNIDFRYGNRELTLNDISLKINKGEKIAIVGESGSGKTTLAKLLLRFYEPETGDILINGNDYHQFEISQIRDKIAYVNQETFLFSDTVKNNLLLGNNNASDEEIIQVCKMASVDEFINNLPFGYNTFLDENGSNLSGGQRQRLSIVRAMLKHPEILILDEATSNLDTVTENGIKNTIFNMNQDLTCIIIAHRLSTIKNCDKIIVMDKGKIIEIGNHDDLMANKGLYYNYYTNI